MKFVPYHRINPPKLNFSKLSLNPSHNAPLTSTSYHSTSSNILSHCQNTSSVESYSFRNSNSSRNRPIQPLLSHSYRQNYQPINISRNVNHTSLQQFISSYNMNSSGSLTARSTSHNNSNKLKIHTPLKGMNNDLEFLKIKLKCDLISHKLTKLNHIILPTSKSTFPNINNLYPRNYLYNYNGKPYKVMQNKTFDNTNNNNYNNNNINKNLKENNNDDNLSDIVDNIVNIFDLDGNSDKKTEGSVELIGTLEEMVDMSKSNEHMGFSNSKGGKFSIESEKKYIEDDLMINLDKEGDNKKRKKVKKKIKKKVLKMVKRPKEELMHIEDGNQELEDEEIEEEVEEEIEVEETEEEDDMGRSEEENDEKEINEEGTNNNKPLLKSKKKQLFKEFKDEENQEGNKEETKVDNKTNKDDVDNKNNNNNDNDNVNAVNNDNEELTHLKNGNSEEETDLIISQIMKTANITEYINDNKNNDPNSNNQQSQNQPSISKPNGPLVNINEYIDINNINNTNPSTASKTENPKPQKTHPKKTVTFANDSLVTIQYNENEQITKLKVFDINEEPLPFKPRNINRYLTLLMSENEENLPKPCIINSEDNSNLYSSLKHSRTNSARKQLFLQRIQPNKNIIRRNIEKIQEISRKRHIYNIKAAGKKAKKKRQNCKKFTNNPQHFFTEKLCDRMYYAYGLKGDDEEIKKAKRLERACSPKVTYMKRFNLNDSNSFKECNNNNTPNKKNKNKWGKGEENIKEYQKNTISHGIICESIEEEDKEESYGGSDSKFMSSQRKNSF